MLYVARATGLVLSCQNGRDADERVDWVFDGVAALRAEIGGRYVARGEVGSG